MAQADVRPAAVPSPGSAPAEATLTAIPLSEPTPTETAPTSAETTPAPTPATNSKTHEEPPPIAILSPAPTSIPAATSETPADDGPHCNHIVFNSILLGGYGEDGWTAAWDVAPTIRGGEKYSLYSFDEYEGTGTGSAVTDYESLAPAYFEKVLVCRDGRDGDVHAGLAVCAPWDCMPRTAAAQGDGTGAYERILRDILVSLGLENPSIDILQNYRVDLDGDGVDEVLLYAENARRGDEWQYSMREGSFSILVLRKIIDGKAENIIMGRSVFLEDTGFEDGLRGVWWIEGFADLNGDGKLEIIVRDEYYEGIFYVVHEIVGDQFEEVLWNGWGY